MQKRRHQTRLPDSPAVLSLSWAYLTLQKTTVGSWGVGGAVPVPQTACSLALVESLLRNKEISLMSKTWVAWGGVDPETQKRKFRLIYRCPSPS